MSPLVRARSGDNMRGGTAVIVALLTMAQPCQLVSLTSLALIGCTIVERTPCAFDGAAQAASGQQTAADRGFLFAAGCAACELRHNQRTLLAPTILPSEIARCEGKMRTAASVMAVFGSRCRPPPLGPGRSASPPCNMNNLHFVVGELLGSNAHTRN